MIPEKMMEYICLNMAHDSLQYQDIEEGVNVEEIYDIPKLVDRINILETEILKDYAKHN